ncbi:metallophosphoesterase [Bordetella trematum]|uniref:Metallo-phosphoesterase n=1 Tax=Bordetella trematum TaxID=123899 RepID=A0A157RC88_9BORD|nr:metallophosphoesterase [Bordetella trematum]AZR92591.1 metallophosphoesterase [Bordetella trematum]NNH19577.1 metallophosphoesterase [Bordetella trematum]SAI55608.1 metallo-phosphoesterase [Bordetella trematum]SAI68792.1 metallo-phosphoesterase [Bordetella trematum]SUV99611.1 metallo-phosphoesterase [Bordetella trematum]
MRLQLLSDLHLEADPDFRLSLAPAIDVLVLAGDIGSYQRGSKLAGEDFGLAQFAPAALGERPPRVIFVPGNHEFDGLNLAEATARLKAVCAQLDIHWLEREVLVIDGVRFVGTTLWADFEALVDPQGSQTQRRVQMEKAFRAANFYLSKQSTLDDQGQPMLAEALRDMALQCQTWLAEALAQPFDGPTVAITHFAPSLRSADPRYGLTPGTAGFCNALDALLPQADLWLHGHLHCPNDYVVEDAASGRRCRVLANPLGYARKGEQAGFQPQCVVELAVAQSAAASW